MGHNAAARRKSRLSGTGLTAPSLRTDQLSDGQANQQAQTQAKKSYIALRVRNRKTLEGAWLAIQRNARSSKSEDTKSEVATFASNLHNNLSRINRQLQKQTFKFPPAKGLKIPKDKRDKENFRPLVVAKVESRVVQRAIHDVLISLPEIGSFVRTPHSFGGIKKAKDDDLAAVPAAIQAVLNAIENGADYIIRSDIKSFFTKISKTTVTDVIASAVHGDVEFLRLFKSAISVELENMAQLRGAAKAFPIEDIGVTQGNSLSPLLGNIILFDFDSELNKSEDVKCIRYIDDFIILAPNKNVAENTYAKSLRILSRLGMETSAEKTQRATVQQGFEFLGVEISNGLLRPNKKSRERMLRSIEKALFESAKAFRDNKSTGSLDRSVSLLSTLSRVSGIMQGWAKHYRFCNDGVCLGYLDKHIQKQIREYLARYREQHGDADDAYKWRLLGIEAISEVERTPFTWPRRKPVVKDTAPASLPSPISEPDPNSLPWE